MTSSLTTTHHVYRLPGHPPDRKGQAAVHFIVVSSIELIVSAEVRDLNMISFAYKTVPGCQVSVNEVEGLQVTHSRRDLRSYVQQTIETKCFDAESECPGSFCRNVVSQELVQVPVFQVLHDDAKRFLVSAHPQHAGDVLVFQSCQDPNVAVKIQSGTNRVLISNPRIF